MANPESGNHEYNRAILVPELMAAALSLAALVAVGVRMRRAAGATRPCLNGAWRELSPEELGGGVQEAAHLQLVQDRAPIPDIPTDTIAS